MAAVVIAACTLVGIAAYVQSVLLLSKINAQLMGM